MRTFIALTFVALAAASCGDDGPSNPVPIVPIPATPISSPIVESHSQPTIGYRPAGGPVLIQLRDDSLHASGDYDDIAIRYIGDVPLVFDTLYIYNYHIHNWQQIQATFPLTPLRVGEDFIWTGAQRLSSQVSSTSPEYYLGTSGRLLLTTVAQGAFDAFLVRYDINYHFVTLRHEGLVWHASMDWHNGRLYVSSGYTVRDSLIVYDPSGERVWSAEYEPGMVTNSAFDGTYLWAYVPSENRLHRIDTTGVAVLSLNAPLNAIDALIWAQQTLWYLGGEDENRGYLYRVDLDSSLVLGGILASVEFRATTQHVSAMAQDSAGFIFAIASSPVVIRRVTFDGVDRESYECGVGEVNAIAWDGESLWALHHGAPAARTDATLLTRFTLE